MPIPVLQPVMRALRGGSVVLVAALLVACVPEPEVSTEDLRVPTTAAGVADPRVDPDSGGAPASAATEAGRLEIRVMDVGQGSAVLIRAWPAGEDPAVEPRVTLIDAGPANRIVGRLRALGVHAIDLMIASHNHADHIGGMDAILDSLPVRFYLDNGHPATTRIQQRVLERVESREVTYLEPSARTLSLGSASLRVIPAPAGVDGDDQNNRSLTVVLQQGDFRALFPGDAETALLNALLATADLPRVQLLKASHHGSRNGVTPAWLARLQPAVVAISLAKGNSYGHPHASALRYYCTGQRQVLRTDLHGDIVVEVSATGTYEVSTDRAAAREVACTPQSAADSAAGRTRAGR
jgi:competence protein ComEC